MLYHGRGKGDIQLTEPVGKRAGDAGVEDLPHAEAENHGLGADGGKNLADAAFCDHGRLTVQLTGVKGDAGNIGSGGVFHVGVQSFHLCLHRTDNSCCHE